MFEHTFPTIQEDVKMVARKALKDGMAPCPIILQAVHHDRRVGLLDRRGGKWVQE